MYRAARMVSALATALLLASALSGCGAQQAGVRPGDTGASFFADQVTYPYPVKYADVRAADGSVWNIGYMDEAPLFTANPKVLVLIHGRAFCGAYFGHVIAAARKHGIRVIVPDLPNYGKSIPGNLDKSLVRSMQVTREVVHDLVVNHLGISSAYYGGHSLGGQFVLGYALSYPEAVAGLLLIAPAGLEELPAEHFPARLAESTDLADFLNYPYYAGKGRLDHSTKAQLIEDFYFYRLKINGKPVPSGFFKRETPDTRLATDIRVGLITANPLEFKRYSMTSLRDVYQLGVEIQRENPDSLYKRYDRIRAPLLLIFGGEEPFYPKKISGLKDLKRDMILPFYQRMTSAGCPVTVKLYPGAGHFPHSDAPEQFAEDVVQFVTTGMVSDAVDPHRFGAAD